MRIVSDRKPGVNTTTWSRVFHNDGLEVFAADKYYDFYKATPQNEKPRYFFGEQAWMDCQRFVVDKIGHSGYTIFN